MTRPHGVRGLFRVNCGAGGGECLREIDTVYFVDRNGDIIGERRIETIQRYKTLWLVKLEGCESPEQAEEYRGCSIAVAARDLPEIDEQEIYWHQLQGLKVFSKSGEDLGAIDDLLEAGSNSVIVVRNDKREIMVPFIDEFVVEVDYTGKKVIVDLPPGLADV